MFNFPPALNKDSNVQKRSKNSPRSDDTRCSFHSGWDSRTPGNGFRDILLAPPAALTSNPTPQDPQLPLEEKPLPTKQRTHQRQMTDILSFHKLPALHTLSTASSPTRDSIKPETSHLPSKELDLQWSPQPSPHLPAPNDAWSFVPTLTGDKSGQSGVQDKGGKLAEWFKGESEPVNLSVLPSPLKEKANPLEVMSSPAAARPSYKLHRKSTSQLVTKPSTTTTSRFAFFKSKTPPTQPAHSSPPPDDEFLTLDINAALFPGGSPDPFSPASFQNLLQNAEGLLLRLQTAYKLRTTSLHEMTAEKEAQAEELEEAETRARHLKMQLDDMAVKVAEQDSTVMNLVDELAAEKQLRRQEEDARKRSIKLVKSSPIDDIAEEDGSKFHQQTNRGSMASDSGFESEDESSAESVFSLKRHDPTSPCLSLSSASSTTWPEVYQAESLKITPVREAAKLRPAVPPQRPSTFQKASGLNGSSAGGISIQGHDEPLRWSCANCQGLKASEAWNVVGILKEENKGLKERVGDLEGAVEGCLDLVAGL